MCRKGRLCACSRLLSARSAGLPRQKLLQPRAVVALNEKKRQIAEYNINNRQENAACSRPDFKKKQPRDAQKSVRELGDTCLLNHQRKLLHCLLREFFLRHELFEEPAHIRHLGLPFADLQRFPELVLPRVGAEGEFFGVQPALRQQSSEEKGQNAKRGVRCLSL